MFNMALKLEEKFSVKNPKLKTMEKWCKTALDVYHSNTHFLDTLIVSIDNDLFSLVFKLDQ